MSNLDWLAERPPQHFRSNQCHWIIQPGEFMIDTWDGSQCSERKPHLLIKCEGCRFVFCTMMHWHMHLDSVPADHFESA